MNRRKFISYLALMGASSYILLKDKAMAKTVKGGFPFKLSENEWKEKLSPQEFFVMREQGTEKSKSSALDKEYGDGSYHCTGCNVILFSSEHKFDSGTGWPSFYQPVKEDVIGYSIDKKLFSTRTEEHCANCGSHLGHVFDDGPEPTGKRHCINGVSLKFKVRT